MGRKGYNDYSPEFKARAIELCLRAITMGWSVARFAKRSGIWKSTMLTWMADDLVFDRYRRAMEIKAVDFPALHADVVQMLIHGVPKRDKMGEIVFDENGDVVREYMDPKRAGVALRSIEFRMQREIKRIYEPTRTVKHQLGVGAMTDSEVHARYEELKKQALAEAKAEDGLMIEGTARKV